VSSIHKHRRPPPRCSGSIPRLHRVQFLATPNMVRSITLLAAVAALALDAQAQGMYTKKSPVLQVDTSNYDRLITKSNYTSIVE
jgi:hypothetical protein